MNRAEFRSWVEQQVTAWHSDKYPTLTVVYQNTEDPQPDAVGAMWLDACISYSDGQDAAVGPSSPLRLRGVIKLMLYVKQGEGMYEADQVLDSLCAHFRVNRRAVEVVLDAPIPHEPPAALGWAKSGWFIPFKNDLA